LRADLSWCSGKLRRRYSSHKVERAAAGAVEPVQDGRIHIEKIKGPFLKEGTPAEYSAD
jgi:hypothetical protein